MKQVAVIGAGIIGSSWSLLFARHGIPVTLYDNDERQRETASQSLHNMLLHSQPLIPTHETMDSILARIRIMPTLQQAVDGADYVQEAIIEKIPQKTDLFLELDRICAPDSILATSSSTFGVSRFAKNLENRSRSLVVHPMTPPHLMPIVEIVPAPFTDNSIVEKTMKFMRSVGQVPVLIKKEVESFVLNRLQGALLMEMFKVIGEDLISPADADDIVRHGLGLRWATLGPLQGIDLNAPEGIADYLQRYGHIFNDMATSRGLDAPVNDTLIQQLQSEMRQQLPLQHLDQRRAWRDKAISKIRNSLSAMPKE